MNQVEIILQIVDYKERSLKSPLLRVYPDKSVHNEVSPLNGGEQ